MIRTAGAILALTYVAVLTAVLLPVQALLTATGAHGVTGIRRFWHRNVARALGLRIHVTGEVVGTKPLMLVANHVSWTDITVLGAIADVSFVAKSEMAKWPLIGWLSWMQRSVYVERDMKRKAGSQASELASRLDAGDVMVLFAEGTTADGTLMLPFKSTLFGAASRVVAERGGSVWLQPVSIAYTRLQGLPMGRQHRWVAAWIGDQDLASHARLLLGERALDVEVHFGEPVEFTPDTDRKAAARLVEARVRAMLADALREPR
jgi:1-acyl-sn-glycerol-3-phosphate acyltransferase